jgi:hypothetical protein
MFTLRPRPLAHAALLLVALALTGCQTYTQQTADRDAAVRSGDLASAVAQADRDAARNDDSKDAILYRLEQGAILRSAALANLPLPVDPKTQAAATPAGQTATAGHTQTNEALLAAAPEQVSPRIAYLTRSLAAFDEAARRIDEFEAQAKVSVSSESAAMLTNQANLPYRGRAYDKVMLHTYQALNYLQLGDSDAARVELNRALQRQRDAVEANAKRIQEAQELAAKAKTGEVNDDQGRKGQSYDVDRAKSDPKTSGALADVESRFNAAILPYGDYVNPFTTFIDALIFTHQAADASDLERARKSWERVVNFAPANTYARADYIAVEPDLQTPASAVVPTVSVEAPVTASVVMTETPVVEAPVVAVETAAVAVPADAAVTEAAVVAAPEAPLAAVAEAVASAVTADTQVAAEAPVAAPVVAYSGPLTYVIFETGSAPYRDQIRIDIPLFLVTGRISYVGAAFPRIETVGGHADRLSIATNDGAGYTAALLASMDSVVAQDFKNEWPTILTKTLISTATKATIDAIIQKQVEDQMGVTGGLLFRVASAATQAAINIADTRTWRSLPKEFHYARIPTPADRVLLLSAAGQTAAVEVEPAAVTVVYVKSTAVAAPLLTGQFVLKK